MHFRDYDTRLAAYALVIDDERMLLTWYNGMGHGEACWSMPGGGVEFDESLEEAVVREVFEETGYHVRVAQPLAVTSFTVPDGGAGRPHKSVRVIYAATVVGGDLGTVEVGGSTDFARWVDLADVPDLDPRADIIDVALATMTP